ncbi:predicted protein [Naegleria gruberi]|uniref:Predicted protein n=1 Tax=Naegleria gruberi TaxID=5762 RepID=D2VWC8_NAEGR|nr:uncharacterized protein NAEGRDRAFT_59401 [Naegleria gruberi]EFC38812.1 predicted protein [Naegleria gruberi]|eukprot:XP_002671556.1 predicted protein [Naegleria gruberi strain NEG-M]
MSSTAIQTPTFSMTMIYDVAASNDKKRKTSPVSEEEHQIANCQPRKSIKASSSTSPSRKNKTIPRVESPKQQPALRTSGCTLNAVNNQELLTSVYSIEQNIKDCLNELKGMEEFGFSSELSMEFEQAFSMLH